jgi:hypothetical protein
MALLWGLSFPRGPGENIMDMVSKSFGSKVSRLPPSLAGHKVAFAPWVAAGFTALGLLVSSCFVEPLGESEKRLDQAGEETGVSTNLYDGADMCQYGIGRGCFDGYVGFKKDFFVAGRSFFNADDLAANFSQMLGETLQVKDSRGNLLVAGQDYTAEMLSTLDQQSFTSGFNFELTGLMQRSGKILESGSFSVNDLLEGTYELRIQRPVRFKLNRNLAPKEAEIPAEPAKRSEAVAAETSPVESKTYCATLYQDSVVEVRKGQRSYQRLSDFKIHVSENECHLTRQQMSVNL